VHLYSIPYNFQQNGKAERFQQTLIYYAKALLYDAKLYKAFWENAVKTACYICNRLPHSSINNKVPFELLYNEKVDYNKLKVFGCQVSGFLHPKHFRKKFENTTSGIFIGYDKNPTAFKIYDYMNNKIVLARAVEFFEDTPGNFKYPSYFPEFIDFVEYYEKGGTKTMIITIIVFIITVIMIIIIIIMNIMIMNVMILLIITITKIKL